MTKKGLILGILFMFTFLLITGCGSESDQVNAPEEEGDQLLVEEKVDEKVEEEMVPVELVFYGASKLSEVGQEEISDYVGREYPHITLKYINNEGDNAIANIVTTNTQVDLVFGSFSMYSAVEQYGLLGEDISDLIRKYQFDLDRIESAYLDLFRSMNDGKLAGLPFYDLRRVMYYNKDIFDMFAISYPEDGMTWEETVDLAKKLTVENDGTPYRGFALEPGGFISTNQFSTPFLDSNTNKASLQTEEWKRFIETYVPLYTMQGYDPTPELVGGAKQVDLFMKDKTAAMFINFNSDARAVDNAGINWDAASFPEVSSLPGIGSQPYPVYVSLTSVIKPEHRDAAFLVLEQLLSDEIQKERSAEKALATPLKSEEVKAVFGSNVDVWEGKNIAAVTSQQPAASVPYSPYNKYAQSAIRTAMVSVILNEKDVNTALREAEEQANQQIEAEMAADG